MPKVTVHRLFWDIVERVDRHAGETFEVSQERAEQLVRNLPDGYVTITESEPEPVDLSKLTKATLLGLAEERGVTVPSKATKADIIKLLEV